jgi:transaldolase
MKSTPKLNIKLFLDGADQTLIEQYAFGDKIAGFTTNPSLARKAGVDNYVRFGIKVAQMVGDKCVSIEVLSDNLEEMKAQARTISTWGSNIFVKVPIVNSRGESTIKIIQDLSAEGIQLNVTAVMTELQIAHLRGILSPTIPNFVSIFAGRIADTGRDPAPLIQQAVRELCAGTQTEIIWASPREILNIFQAINISCHAITLSHDLVQKLSLLDRDLEEYSIATARMFIDDAIAAGYQI